jgi:multiple sugar transport system permease protein
MFLYNPMFGLFNRIIGLVGIPPQGWVYQDTQVIPSLVLMSVWASGNVVVIYLAGLQGISRQMYEAVEIDGGGVFRKFFHITVPMMTPLIFYNGVLTVIYSLQTFTQAFIMTEGGPKNASLFYMLLLYRTAFRNQQMGYASAMAWVMLVIIGILTAIAFRTSRSWVYYGGGSRDE